MKQILLGAMFLLVGLCAYAKDDQKVIYLGDDRYTCRGDGCGAFMAAERGRQAARERERQREVGRYNESREQRQRERDSSSRFDPYDTSAWRD